MEKQFKLPHMKMSEVASSSGSYAQAIIDQIRAIENTVSPDSALSVYCEVAGGAVKVQRLEFTNSALIVVHGVDAEGNSTAFISTSSALQLTCKVTKAEAGAPNMPIAFDLLEARAAGA